MIKSPVGCQFLIGLLLNHIKKINEIASRLKFDILPPLMSVDHVHGFLHGLSGKTLKKPTDLYIAIICNPKYFNIDMQHANELLCNEMKISVVTEVVLNFMKIYVPLI